jgi:hypothetical protein
LFNGTTQIGTTVADGTGQWAIAPTVALADGTYTLTVKNITKDVAVGSRKVMIDSQADAPVTALALDPNSDTGTVGDKLTSQANPVITGGGATAGATVRLYEGSTVLGQTVADSTGQWRVQTSSLSNGAHSLTAVQVDAAGNASNASAALTLTVDTQAAALSAPVLGSGADTGLQDDNRTQLSSFTVKGQGAEANAWVTVYNGPDVLASVQADGNGAWSALLSNLSGTSTGKSYSLTAKQTDAAGNVSAASAVLALVVDNAASAPTITGLVATATNDTGVLGDGRTENTRPVLAGTAEAGASVQVLRDDGNGVTTLLATVLADASTGAWTWQPTADLATGSYKYVAVQTDLAGNVSVGSPAFLLSITPKATVSLTSLMGTVSGSGGQLGDINNDGLVDVLSVNAYVQTTTGSFVQGNTLQQGNGVGARMAGSIIGQVVDINNDGVTDFWLLNNGLKLGTNSNAMNTITVNVSGAGDNTSHSGTVADMQGTGKLAGVFNGGPRLWMANGKLVGLAGDNTSSRTEAVYDVNGDGYLDIIYADKAYGTLLAKGDGTGFTKLKSGPSYGGYLSHTTTMDINHDGMRDVFSGSNIYTGQGTGYTTDVTTAVGYSGGSSSQTHAVVADLNADGWDDLLVGTGSNSVDVWLNRGGKLEKQAANAVFDRTSIVLASSNVDAMQLSAMDVNGDRSIDMLATGPGGAASLIYNQTVVAENTYLRVKVATSTGNETLAAGATVSLYDHSTGAWVSSQLVGNNVLGTYMSKAGNPYVEFFGLDPAKTYDVVVRYPGNDQGVTVLTGKSGLGTSGIASSALREVVDSQLTNVSPGGKDVITVAREDRSTSSDGGNWAGTRYADWMVGDRGDDTFTPNGANVGEAGDTVDLSNGGHDKVVFNTVLNLNSVATITSFTTGASSVADSDSINVSGLLTALGYTGARDAASLGWTAGAPVKGMLKVSAAGDQDASGNIPETGKNLLLSVFNGSGWQALALIKGTTDLSKLSLSDLVASGNLQLGQLNLAGTSAFTLTEAAAKGKSALFTDLALTTDGGTSLSFAQDFKHASLKVSLGDVYAEDQFSVASGAGVSVTGSNVSYNNVVIGTVNSTFNGVGKALEVDFDFAGTSLTSAQQADAVQAVARAVQYQNTGNTPADYYRDLSIAISDGQSTAKMVGQLTVTPVADTATVAGKSVVSGTNGVDTLTGTSAAETFVGYGGPVANAGTASATGDTLTGGGGHDSFVYRKGNVGQDTITDFGVYGQTLAQSANADVINVANLLQGFVQGTSAVNDFVRIVDNGTGTAQLQVDYNGKADGSGFMPYMSINLTGVTLASTGAASFAALRDTLVARDQLLVSDKQLQDQLAAVAKIADYAAGKTTTALGLDVYAAAGVLDVGTSNIDTVNADVLTAGSTVARDPYLLQNLVNHVVI